MEVDPATIEAARRGDTAARAALLGALQDSWYRFCFGLLRDPEAARDATQETALRFLKQLGGFKGQSQLRTWSLSIALNVVREARRRARPQDLRIEPGMEDAAIGAVEPRHLGSDPPADAERSEDRSRLLALLEGLPQRQREAVILRIFEEFSTEQTASVMGCATGTVKATLHQALRALRKGFLGTAGHNEADRS